MSNDAIYFHRGKVDINASAAFDKLLILNSVGIKYIVTLTESIIQFSLHSELFSHDCMALAWQCTRLHYYTYKAQ